MSLDTSKIFKSGGEFYTVRWAVEGPSAGVGLYGGHNGIGLGGRDFAFAIADWPIDVSAADSVTTIAVTNSGPGGWRPGQHEREIGRAAWRGRRRATEGGGVMA